MMKSVIIKDDKGKVIIKVFKSSKRDGCYGIDYRSYLEGRITVTVVDEKNKRTRIA